MFDQINAVFVCIRDFFFKNIQTNNKYLTDHKFWSKNKYVIQL